MGYLDQLKRTRRWLEKFENASALTASTNITLPSKKQDEYEDVLYAFFQNCWHLKDWIKNDDTAPHKLRSAVRQVEKKRKLDSLMLSADIANGSKHLKIKPQYDRRGGKVEAEIMVKVMDSLADATNSDATVAFKYTIMESSGKVTDALDLARRALSDWEKLIKANGGTI